MALCGGRHFTHVAHATARGEKTLRASSKSSSRREKAVVIQRCAVTSQPWELWHVSRRELIEAFDSYF